MHHLSGNVLLCWMITKAHSKHFECVTKTERLVADCSKILGFDFLLYYNLENIKYDVLVCLVKFLANSWQSHSMA